MLAHRPSKPLRPPRVRHEPPTLAEAFAAAGDLTDDAERMVEIAAGLMGIPVEEARPHFAGVAARATGMTPERIVRPSRRTVIVERRRRIGA